MHGLTGGHAIIDGYTVIKVFFRPEFPFGYHMTTGVKQGKLNIWIWLDSVRSIAHGGINQQGVIVAGMQAHITTY